MTHRSRQLATVTAALVAGFSIASCSDGGGGAVTVGGTPGEGSVSGTDRSQPAGWAAAIQADTWTVALEAGAAVTIVMCSSMPSSSFDPYLQMDFMGETVASDDDSAGNLNARIVYTPMRSGTYDIYAMSREGTAPANGASYTLRVLAGAMYDVTCPPPGGS